MLRKCRKKEITYKHDCWSKRILIISFNEIAINYESQLKKQLIFFRYFCQ